MLLPLSVPLCFCVPTLSPYGLSWLSRRAILCSVLSCGTRSNLRANPHRLTMRRYCNRRGLVVQFVKQLSSRLACRLRGRAGYRAPLAFPLVTLHGRRPSSRAGAYLRSAALKSASVGNGVPSFPALRTDIAASSLALIFAAPAATTFVYSTPFASVTFIVFASYAA